jgi:hypothetical protein
MLTGERKGQIYCATFTASVAGLITGIIIMIAGANQDVGTSCPPGYSSGDCYVAESGGTYAIYPCYKGSQCADKIQNLSDFTVGCVLFFIFTVIIIMTCFSYYEKAPDV